MDCLACGQSPCVCEEVVSCETEEVVRVLETESFRLVTFCPSQEWLDNWAREHGYS